MTTPLKNRLRHTFVIGCLLASGLLAPAAIQAATIPLGVVSFNTLIPSAPGSPGVNDFEVDNFTGANSLPPDFPASDPVTFLGSSIELFPKIGAPTTIMLGDLAPGTYTPAALQFSADTLFNSAIFTATLGPASFGLSDGSTFSPNSLNLMVNLIPSSSASLAAGTDFVLITASDVSAAPEPNSGAYLVAICFGVAWLRRRHPSNK
jgi:hypothetical protein